MSVREEAGASDRSAANGSAAHRPSPLPPLGRRRQRLAEEWQQVQTTRSRLVQSQSVLQQQHGRLVQFSQQWSEYAKAVNARAHATEQRAQQLADLQARLDAESSRLDDERAAHQMRCEEISAQETSLAERELQLEAEANRLSGRLQEVEERDASLREQSDQLREEIERDRAELTALREALAVAAADLKAREDGLSARAAELAADSSALATDQTHLAGEREALALARHELERAQALLAEDEAERRAAIAQQLARAEAASDEADRGAAELVHAQEELRVQAEALAAERARFDQLVEEHEQELAVRRKDVVDAKLELEEQSGHLSSELEQLRAWGEQLARQASELEGEAGRLVNLDPPVLAAPAPAALNAPSTAREGALRLLAELPPVKAVHLLRAYAEAGVAELTASTVASLDAVAGLLKADGRAAVARSSRVSGLPANVAVAAALLTRRKLDVPLEGVTGLDLPVIDELLDRRAVGLDEAIHLCADDAEWVRARLGDTTLPLDAVQRLGWGSELLRRSLSGGEGLGDSAEPSVALAHALLSATSGDVEQLLALQQVPVEYQPLVSFIRAVRDGSEAVELPQPLADDVTLWPLLGRLLIERTEARIPDGAFASWVSLLRARRSVRIGGLGAARDALAVALSVDSPWRAEALLLAGYLAMRECDGDTAMRYLDEALAANPDYQDRVTQNRAALERARARGEWISPLVVLGLGEDESASVAGRAWGARIRDSRLLDPQLRDERNADLNWALEVVEAGTNEPWYRVSTEPELPTPSGSGLLNPEPSPLPRQTSFGVSDVHTAASTWLDQVVSGLLTVTPEQRKAQDA